LVVLAIAVFMFGAKKLPEVAKGLGQGIREFKTSLKAEEKAEPVIDCTLPVRQAGDAHALVERFGNVGKVVLSVQ
jgi:sec-independent protein translocase protein TatA